MTATEREEPSGPVFYEPEHGPSSDAAANIAEWKKLVSSSVERTSATAEKWRTGLAAFVTLITSLLILKGPETASKIAEPWNWLVIGLLVVGTACAVVGLWLALEAASPSNFKDVPYGEVVDKYGSVQAHNVAVASTIIRKLSWAKLWVVLALALIGAGIVAWWVVPPASPTHISVSYTDESKRPLCGVLEDSSNGSITIRPKDKNTVLVDLANVASIKTVAVCQESDR